MPTSSFILAFPTLYICTVCVGCLQCWQCWRNKLHHFEQEGWLSPTERASVSAISLRFIIWLPHESRSLQSFGYVKRVLKRHILASPEYARGTIVVNVTWMERGFNACQTHRSIVPIYLQPFPSNSTLKLKNSHFSTFLHILSFPGYAPGTIAVNVTWIEREFNAGQTPRNIYPSIFNHLGFTI